MTEEEEETGERLMCRERKAGRKKTGDDGERGKGRRKINVNK